MECIEVFDFFNKTDSYKYALVVLNSDVSYENSLLSEKEFHHLWSNAYFKASVDGATNFIDQINLRHGKQQYIPDLVSGDFDSIDNTLLNKYAEIGTIIKATLDQDHTDFTKCLKVIGNGYYCDGLKKIIALSYGMSDRFDQVVANVNSLFLAKQFFPSTVQVCLLLPQSCIYLINKGTTKIIIDPRYSLSECGLLPIFNNAVVNTCGFSSDCDNTNLEIGQMMNFLCAIPKHTENVTVSTNEILLFHIGRTTFNVLC